MSGEDHTCVHEKLRSASREDMLRLVRGMSRQTLTHVVSRSQYLQQKVFKGFRPTHLPWDQAPARLVRDAGGELELRQALLSMWMMDNGDLPQLVADLVTAENFERDVEALLAAVGVARRESLWWALHLDGRDEVHKLFEESGVFSALLDPESPLVLRAAELAAAGGEAVGDEDGAPAAAGESQGKDEEDEDMSGGGESAAPAVTYGDNAGDGELRERLREALRLLDEARAENDALRLRVRRLEGDLSLPGAGFPAGEGE